MFSVADLFDGERVDYAMSERMTRKLMTQALFRAIGTARPGKGLLHHWHRGW